MKNNNLYFRRGSVYTNSIYILSFILLLNVLVVSAQTIHPLEAAQQHYATLQKLNSKPNSKRAALDDIIFPPEKYSSGSLIYTMVTPAYLTPAQVTKLKNSIQYPANSSDQTKAELEFLLSWQNKRTKSQEDRSLHVLAPIGYWPHADVLKNHPRHQQNLDYLFYEGRTVLGNTTTAENYPATAKLLKGITKDMRLMEFTVKYHLLRPRPYHLEPTLEPLARISSPSFASGHTLWTYIQAFAWSELIPEKRKEFLAIAYEVGESREIMGIHYPSDEEGARVLAHRMLTAMSDNPIFIKDLEAAKGEWRK
ncbi:phosphatase PAP2 family protein [Aquimarina sp. 2201CG14-23]|uniref:phosphatase PAP2 family protein n=1 Tax=Aquimarina mycalae TaxID=3040073 RepID=UPI00247801C0|nr:phosphatase PAP2 family protein [Aquimarina sp. 2201CG14-23]MDH7445519.1 phosphatase PAP2 family protein [Aquimarina sp. 2201CG14-23]